MTDVIAAIQGQVGPEFHVSEKDDYIHIDPIGADKKEFRRYHTSVLRMWMNAGGVENVLEHLKGGLMMSNEQGQPT